MSKQFVLKANIKSIVATLCLLQAFVWPSRDYLPVTHKRHNTSTQNIQYSSFAQWPFGGAEWRQRLMLRGIYNGKNLVVQNPYSTEKGYCVSAIVVNGELNETVARMSEFEIDPGSYGIKPGEEVDIMIEHSRNCIPNIINPEVLR